MLPGRDDREPRSQRHVGQFETTLIVALENIVPCTEDLHLIFGEDALAALDKRFAQIVTFPSDRQTILRGRPGNERVLRQRQGGRRAACQRNAQFVASICRTLADHRFVLLISAANAFVAARMSTRMPPGALVASAGG